MKTVAIIGIGLIGGSLGQALRKTRRYRVIGISRGLKNARLAKRLGAVDVAATDFAVVQEADIVVLAGPVDTIVPTLKRILPLLRSGTVVTDISSVKGEILRKVSRLPWPKGVSFVGGHPLAGSHRTGVQAARPNLFKNAVCVLVPLGRASLGPVKTLWKSVGARVLLLSAVEHDQVVAVTSHLPHLIAHALVHAVLHHPRKRTMLPLLAGSFRDVTRVASSDPEQWRQILAANAPAIRQALSLFRKELGRLEKRLSKSGLLSSLTVSHRFRHPLFHGL